MEKLFAFIYPYEHVQSGNRASSIRPYKMEQAFERVLSDSLIIRRGTNRFSNLSIEQLQGVYIESINRPFFIQRILDKKLNIFKDYMSIRQLKRHDVKLAIFYRDGFWAGDFLFELYSYPIAFLLRIFYKLEWQFIKHYFDAIYLPSLELAEYMGESDTSRFKVLLPGCSPTILKRSHQNSKTAAEKNFTFLYAGGVIPPLNDISLMLKLLGNRPNFKLILILRKEELKQSSEFYQLDKFSNLEIILSKRDEQLMEYYSQADASLLLYPYHPYRYLAMPFKAFESIGYGLPLISFSDNVMGKFITNCHLGISSSMSELDSLFSNYDLLNDLLISAQTSVRKYAIKNTWDKRVDSVINDMFRNQCDI